MTGAGMTRKRRMFSGIAEQRRYGSTGRITFRSERNAGTAWQANGSTANSASAKALTMTVIVTNIAIRS